MTLLVCALRRASVRADDLLLAARDRLTLGQRWTATILGLVAVAVLLAGSPTRTLVLPGGRAAGAGQPAPPDRAEKDARAVETTVREPASATRSAVQHAGSPENASSDIADPGGPAGSGTAARVTLLLPPASGGVPGRTEADVAQVFAAGSDFDVAATAGTDDADACEVVGGSGVVVLGPEAVPPDLVGCLTASGATLLAFDPGGSRQGVVSTRRSQVDALVALASWATGTDAVPGEAVGIVGGAEDQAWVEAALPGVAEAEAGLDVVATAYVGDAASVSSEVRAFATKGVNTVVLAAPMAVRRQWAAQHALLDASVRFVVADAHDGVGQESYAPTFDGALAHTTLRVPWHARHHGESPEQTRCRQRWEESAMPPTLLGADETRWVYAWCQHVALAGAARQAASAAGRQLAETLRMLSMASPLTADLGPTVDGSWGPTGEAVLVWRASCGCWQEQVRFSELRASSGAQHGV